MIHLPPTHQTTMARGDSRLQQVLIDTALDVSTNGLDAMSEAELVSKGQASIALMGIEASDTPEGIRFKGARKLRNGGVLYKMDSSASATRLKSDGVMIRFLEKSGGTSVIKDHTYTVVAEYIPTTINLDMNVQDEFSAIEGTNNLQPLSILCAKWIKPPHQRTKGQRTAHLLISLELVRWPIVQSERDYSLQGKRYGCAG